MLLYKNALNKNLPDVFTELSSEFDVSKEPFHEIISSYYITSIFKSINKHDYNKMNYYKILLKYYDKSTGLFFQDSNSDNLKKKLEMTNYTLKTLENLEIKLDDKKLGLLKKHLINLFNDSSFLSIDSIDTDTIIYNYLIIDSLYILDYNLNLSPDLNTWLNSVNNYTVNVFNIDALDSIKLLNMSRDLNNIFMHEFNIPNNILNSISSIYSFQDISGFNLLGYVDSQILNNSLLLFKNNNKSFPFINELNDYLSDQITSMFNKTGHIELNIEDNYYGVKLANITKYPYDKNKVLNKLSSDINKFSNKDIVVSLDDLENLYYLLLTLKELDMNTKNFKHIRPQLISSLNQIDYYNSNLDSNSLNDIYYGLNTIVLLDGEISDNIKDNCKNYINILLENNDIYSNVICLKLYYISSLLDIDFSNNVADKINKNINRLKNSSGYMQSISNESPQLLATAEIVLFKTLTKTLSNDDVNTVNSFLLNNVTETKYGYISKLEKLNLKSLYYTTIIMNSIQN